jgi:hypothetical protein
MMRGKRCDALTVILGLNITKQQVFLKHPIFTFGIVASCVEPYGRRNQEVSLKCLSINGKEIR